MGSIKGQSQAAAQGVISHIQRFSLHDGPGIRSTVFLKGCPLTCPWCHNPESISPLPEPVRVVARCLDCGACVGACTRGLSMAQLPANCQGCGECARACPTGARRLIGRRVTPAALLAEIARDRPFFVESGGGVTFSGGEPLAQSAFLMACLVTCREAGLTLAVETSGYATTDICDSLSRHVDLVLFDLKLLDPVRHREVTGVPLDLILENLHLLADSAGELWVRVPLIPGVNDAPEHLQALGRQVASLKNTRRLHLLPYHPLGTNKSMLRGGGGEFAVPTPMAIQAALAVLADFDLDLRVGG